MNSYHGGPRAADLEHLRLPTATLEEKSTGTVIGASRELTTTD
jgi:hypothetical protein